MSRINDLVREAKRLDPSLGAALETEVRHLQERRAFGLNFERHTPESVELYGRTVRVGDKVRMLPPRGLSDAVDRQLWKVVGGTKDDDGSLVASLRAVRGEDEATWPLDDLVVVAEHTDAIYPGLVSTERINRGGDQPWHTVINAENLHALQALLFTHRGLVDCIYIDPPYNTGARDWKYNNDYVEADDHYRHSKWLAFMERRLRIARDLLNPSASVLIAAIDEKEYLRLGLLLEQVFPEGTIQMVSTVVNATGAIRANEFSRVNEYLFFVIMGDMRISPDRKESAEEVPWNLLQRREMASHRGSKKGGPEQFYPIYVDQSSGCISKIGDALPHGVPRASVPDLPGCVAVFPMKPDGTEMNWGLTAPSLRALHSQGFVRVVRGRANASNKFTIYYLTSGKIESIARGEAHVMGRRADGSVVAVYTGGQPVMPTTVWSRDSHNAQSHGTKLLSRLIPGRSFPFPKSLYAVEDSIAYFIRENREAVVLDFFAGSGTTAHAVMRLNELDGGQRRSVSITNNEVGADRQAALGREGLRPGDDEWESQGICEAITRPRIAAAITGVIPSGEAVTGDYRFRLERPIAQGLRANVEFFDLTYEAPLEVSANLAFERIAPLLWLRAGARGRRIDSLGDGWDVVDAYGVLERFDALDEFLDALVAQPEAKVAFLVTDDDRRFEATCAMLPDGVEPVRLYASYLRNFQIDAARSSR